MTEQYNEADCITAGELRAAGLIIDEKIPDIGWVPRWSYDVKFCDAKAGPDGTMTVQADIGFREPFRWFEFTVQIDPTPRTCLSCGATTDPYGNLPCGH
ncbi:hypothetical protein [Paraburkholderia sp. BL17N1]|uniref:hypothetical protein n=1 Tax=Paraburkholderia sp. BL17N1 TaxID=1938798 RepID=UPI000EB57B53|nr:hypothetical protein [Paraburkholderia sp. BL17N1]RKR46292.1 hypothetical protein B0G82_3974 [Paraburkholderia sp. BL17N1]